MRKTKNIWMRAVSFAVAAMLASVLAAAPVTAKAAASKVHDSDLIWFGDSRTVQMGMYVYKYSVFSASEPSGYITASMFHRSTSKSRAAIVAKGMEGYSWASGMGYLYLTVQLNVNRDAYVVCNWGVNDYYTTKDAAKKLAKKYVSLYKKIADSYPDAHIVVMSVNPVKGNANKNQHIVWLNGYLKSAAKKNGWTYVNTFSMSILAKASSYADSAHYTTSAYKAIRKKVLGSLS